MSNSEKFYGTGHRKSSIARVYLSKGTGKVTVNGKDINEYLPLQSLVMDALSPFKVSATEGQFDVVSFVKGGGFTGQTGALRLGITRALLEAGVDKKLLKSFGLVTRDSRVKERKKYGLKAARRAPQFSKR